MELLPGRWGVTGSGGAGWKGGKNTTAALATLKTTAAPAVRRGGDSQTGSRRNGGRGGAQELTPPGVPDFDMWCARRPVWLTLAVLAQLVSGRAGVAFVRRI